MMKLPQDTATGTLAAGAILTLMLFLVVKVLVQSSV